ncbi:MAG: hypothetical protein MRZ79_10255 [Bacteroidia bacterium]|nr:hypothetical protein [Bacteroidia bacterium]
MKKIACISIIFLLLLPLISFAHRPNEVVYKIFKKEDNWMMKIHLTPSAAFHILEKTGKLPDETETVNLDAYGLEIENYFQETLRIYVDEAPIDFVLQQWSLQDHDASMTFQLKGLAENWNSIKVHALSFLDIFQTHKNIVYIRTKKGTYAQRLNHQKYSVIFSQQSTAKEKIGINANLLWAGGGLSFILLAIIGLIWYSSKKEKLILGTE